MTKRRRSYRRSRYWYVELWVALWRWLTGQD